MTPEEGKALKRNSVVQIVSMPPTHNGWVGAFVLVMEVKSWGIQGFVHYLESHDKHSEAHTRLKWDQIAYIGEAEMGVAEEEPS